MNMLIKTMNSAIKISKLPTIIRQRRLTAKLSLSQLSKLAEIDVPHLSRIERGEMMPDLNTLEKIFNELHLMIEVKQTTKFDEE